jgi:hypothetical protein
MASFIRFDRWSDDNEDHKGGHLYVDGHKVTAVCATSDPNKTLVRADGMSWTVCHPLNDVIVSVDRVLFPDKYKEAAK